MSSSLSRFVRMLMLAIVLGLATARPASAADDGPSILRDTETEALFQDVAKPLIEAANLDNKSVKVVLLNDDEINAFVAGSQNVYVNSGLVTRADNVNQLQFVIAHELGHVAGGHAIRMGEGMKEATGITLATMVLGAIAIAAGAGDAGLGLMMMGQQAALGSSLRSPVRRRPAPISLARAIFTRRASAARAASTSSRTAEPGVSHRGSMHGQAPTAPHPLSSERIAMLTIVRRIRPGTSRHDPALEARFQRVKAKLVGFINPKQAISKYPEIDQTVPAHYARAYAYHLAAYPDKALTEADALLKDGSARSIFPGIEGPDHVRDSARPADAIAPLREATDESGKAPLIASMLGHALISTEDQKNIEEAKEHPEERHRRRQ